MIDPLCRLITVVGQGGIGKSRLALVGVEYLIQYPHFTDGVWFVPLNALDGDSKTLTDDIAIAIATALNLELAGKTSPRDQLFSYLKGKRLVLVLDNYEHLLRDGQSQDGVDFVLDMLDHVPTITILITSRKTLNIENEYVLSLDGLPVPHLPNDIALTYPSMQLFLEQGRRVGKDIKITEKTLSELVDTCQFLEGIPLGLELAASRLREMSCAKILHSLRENLDILETQFRDLPVRHRSIRSVFSWSWDLLTEDQQRVLAGLSVVRGGFTLEAAEAVTGAAPEVVFSLLAHSLLGQAEAQAPHP